ncbi:MAG: C40 family peptidase [Lewinellaceae bacterium]|nr:C40 family peptidase [Lewinellaceae bacterium]
MPEASFLSKIPQTLLVLFFTGIFFIASAFDSGRHGGDNNVSENSSEIFQLRERITGYAQQYQGIHYRYAGRSPQTGFDCSGFTSYVLKEFDVQASASSALQARQGDRILLDKVQPGDLVFFGRGSRIQHVAMVVERNAEGVFCVHSTCSRGVIVENILKSSYWKPRILYARDIISAQVQPLDYIAE